MANNHMKKCSTSVIISKMEIEIIGKYHFSPIRMDTFKKQTAAAKRRK